MSARFTHGRTVLWEPSESAPTSELMLDFLAWVGENRGVALAGYRDALAWSVSDLSGFWDALREFFGVVGNGFAGPALADERMPGARWYPGATVNFAENVLRHAQDPTIAATAAIVDLAEDGGTEEISWRELADRVASFAAALRGLGIERGGRVAAVLPNVPEAIIGLLATASIGATWCVCAPDLAPRATVDRLVQLDATVLIASVGYRFNGGWFDRAEHLKAVIAHLPTVRHVITVGESPAASPEGSPAASIASIEGGIRFDSLIGEPAEASFAAVPFDHPLWVLFTSGTTGTPKGIVHGHGGMTLEAIKMMGLQFGMNSNDRYYVAANTSWMVWNTLLMHMISGASVVTYAGSTTQPRVDKQFEIVARTGATMLGTGAAYLRLVEASGLRPRDDWDLHRLHTVMSTGSTLPDSTAAWLSEAARPGVHLADSSGGTDICSAFLGANPLEPVRVGRMQGALLGVAVEVWNEAGQAVIDEVGEMVITRPMPSMPLFFWGDDDGSRYRDAYFERFPGVWTQGDWIVEGDDGSFEVLGRSDATLNRQGVRLGSAEIYGALTAVPAIRDSLVIGIELPDGGYHLPLFVVLDSGRELDDDLRAVIVSAIRAGASARHVPDEIVAAPALPITHAGKKIEVPIKRLFTGIDPSKVDRGSLANPDALDWFITEAQRFRAERGLDR